MRTKLPDGLAHVRATNKGFKFEFTTTKLPAWYLQLAKNFSPTPVLIDRDKYGTRRYGRNVEMQFDAALGSELSWSLLQKQHSGMADTERRKASRTAE